MRDPDRKPSLVERRGSIAKAQAPSGSSGALAFDQTGEKACFRGQFFIGSALCDCSAFDDIDAVGAANCAEAVGDQNSGDVQPVQAFGDDGLRAVVESAGRFIEHEDGWLADQRTSDEGECYRIRARIPATQRLKWWLRGFGDDVTVLAPTELALAVHPQRVEVSA